MNKIVRIVLAGLLLFPAVTRSVRGQNVPVQVTSPVYQGFKIPTINGTLHYSLSAAERISLGYNGVNQTSYATTVSGDVGFITPSILYPFSLVYGGGYSTGSDGEPSTYFQSLSMNQAFNRKSYTINFNDSLSYLPESPSTGLAGLPGLGDIGTTPVPTGPQEVLTTSGARVENTAAATVSAKLTGKTSLNINGQDVIQRFIGSDANAALESNGYGGGVSVSHRIDARTSFSASYHYNNFSYTALSGSIASQGATFSYNRQLTRQLSVGLGGGPERIGGSTLTGAGPNYTYNADLHASYSSSGESATSYNVGYIRSSNAGSGVSAGAETDSLFVSASRRLAQSLQGSISLSYSNNTSLDILSTDSFTSKSVVGSGQLGRALTRTISVFASYTAQHQISNGIAQGIAPLQGLVQTLSFGVTYSPSEVRLGRQ
jgi:hypothetical protein